MGRGRSSGGRGSRSSGGSSSRRSTSKPRKASSPAPTATAPTQVDNKSTMGTSSGSAFSEGFAFGAGNAVAHRAVDSISGPRITRHEIVSSSATPTPNTDSRGDECAGQYDAFLTCLNKNKSEISKCQPYMDLIVKCRSI